MNSETERTLPGKVMTYWVIHYTSIVLTFLFGCQICPAQSGSRKINEPRYLYDSTSANLYIHPLWFPKGKKITQHHMCFEANYLMREQGCCIDTPVKGIT